MPIRTGFAPGNRVPNGNYWESSSAPNLRILLILFVNAQSTAYFCAFSCSLCDTASVCRLTWNKVILSQASLSKRILPRALVPTARRKKTPCERDKDRYRGRNNNDIERLVLIHSMEFFGLRLEQQ